MSQTDALPSCSVDQTSDHCSRCGRMIARTPVFYGGQDVLNTPTSKIICLSCSKKERRRKKGWLLIGQFFELIEYGGYFFWIAALIIGAILAAGGGWFGRK